MKQFWKNLPVRRKLYVVVGIMATLIASELFTLLFAMNTLSAIRAFVAGEGNWSKAEKSAVQSLFRYAIDGNEHHYDQFLAQARIAEGYQIARVELSKGKNFDREIVWNAFIQGGNDPDDIGPVINFLVRFKNTSYLQRAIEDWIAADRLFDVIKELAASLHQQLQAEQRDASAIKQTLLAIASTDEQLTKHELNFSSMVGKGSRFLERAIMIILCTIVLTVETIGLSLTVIFSQSLTKSLNELITTAKKVRTGDFSHRAPVRSRDELGMLAVSFNRMTIRLAALVRNRDDVAARLKASESNLIKANEELEQRVQERTQEIKAKVSELIAAKKMAEASNEAKSSFLANMSHEIRTPLTAILGFAEILFDSDTPLADKRRAMQVIRKNGALLTNIIDDILDLAKVEAGKIVIEPKTLDLAELIDDVAATAGIKCQPKSITFRIEVDNSVPDHIETDGVRLKQILNNIIGNAIKFTDQGEVSVYIDRDDQNPNLLRISVSDTGAGIDESHRSALFSPFTQADASSTRRHGGTGLGLALSRRLAIALGGNVHLKKSVLGYGSTFVVTVAITAPSITENIQSHQNNVTNVVHVDETE